MVKNARFPHYCRIYREPVGTDGLPQTDELGNRCFKLIFESQCGYRDATRGIRQGEVTVAQYKIGLPWFDVEIKENDRIEMKDYTRTFYGQVVKASTYNFGSNIWFDEIKN